jgi:hypothetical protein
MTDNVIKLVWNKDDRNAENDPSGRTGEIVDLRASFPTFYATAQFLEELVVMGRTLWSNHVERYGFFEVRGHLPNGNTQIEQLYFPEKYQIPKLQKGVVYVFPVTPDRHPETDEMVMMLCHNDPITRLI